jgi:hypothetical protein
MPTNIDLVVALDDKTVAAVGRTGHVLGKRRSGGAGYRRPRERGRARRQTMVAVEDGTVLRSVDAYGHSPGADFSPVNHVSTLPLGDGPLPETRAPPGTTSAPSRSN